MKESKSCDRSLTSEGTEWRKNVSIVADDDDYDDNEGGRVCNHISTTGGSQKQSTLFTQATKLVD